MPRADRALAGGGLALRVDSQGKRWKPQRFRGARSEIAGLTTILILRNRLEIREMEEQILENDKTISNAGLPTKR